MWLYKAIVRPILMYGAIVWIGSLRKKRIIKELVKMQRLACLMVTGAMRSTPTAGMEVILGIQPLEIALKEAAMATCIRLRNNGDWRANGEERLGENSHVRILNELVDGIKELEYPQDKLRYRKRKENNYKVVIGQREELNKIQVRPMPYDRGKINCFTDGSKSEEGTGNAFKIFSQEVKKGESRYLGETTTVFQAEITAITSACQAIIEEGVRQLVINFYVDSQSALRAVDSYVSRNKCMGVQRKT